MNKRVHTVVMLSFLLIVFLISYRAFCEDADELLKQVREQYESHKNICAEFTQIFYWKLADERQEIHGKICVKNGVQFRIESQDQIIVTDSKIVWTLNKLNKQVTIDYANPDEQENPFLKSFFEKYFNDYNAKFIGTEKVENEDLKHLQLTAKVEEAFIRKLDLWIEDKTAIIKRVTQLDLNENETQYVIHKVEFDPELPAKYFSLQIPDDYEVLDFR
jgi:outer membrane lipoprotein-sorting protein